MLVMRARCEKEKGTNFETKWVVIRLSAFNDIKLLFIECFIRSTSLVVKTPSEMKDF